MTQGTAIVTRCTQGVIGRAVALQLARDGFNVAISDDPSQQSALAELQREIEGMGVRCRSFTCDLFEEREIENLIKTVAKDLGGVDVVCLSSVPYHPDWPNRHLSLDGG